MQKNKFSINVVVVAHVDHGKSTLCDAIIENCTNINLNSKTPTLDSHEIEKTRGVTIRNHFIKLDAWNSKEKKYYQINLIDSPGHYDFAQYVSVAVNSANVVLLLIDATKGIQPQTLSYMNMCRKIGVSTIVVINKIDILFTDVQKIKNEIIYYFNVNENQIVSVSAYMKLNIDLLMNKILENNHQISYVEKNSYKKQCLYVLDCTTSSYGYTKILLQSVNFNVINNNIINFMNKKCRIKSIYTKTISGNKEINEISDNIFYIEINIDIKFFIDLIGYMIMYTNNNQEFKKLCKDNIHLSYIGILSNNNNYDNLEKAINKLLICDPGVKMHKRFSKLYGNIFVCGFLGDFHREVFLERLYIEYNVGFATCYINSPYIFQESKQYVVIDYKNKLINNNFRKYLSQILTPFIIVNIMFKEEYYNKVYAYISQNNYNQIIENKIINNHFIFIVKMPFTLILYGLSEQIKNLTNGYIELIIENLIYDKKELAIIEFFINNELIEELTIIEIQELSESVASNNLEKIKSNLERQQFILKLSAKINRKTFKSFVVKPYRKNVTAKLYGGDSTRKKKLLKKQKEGKNKMIKHGNISSIKNNILNLMVNSSTFKKTVKD